MEITNIGTNNQRPRKKNICNYSTNIVISLLLQPSLRLQQLPASQPIPLTLSLQPFTIISNDSTRGKHISSTRVTQGITTQISLLSLSNK